MGILRSIVMKVDFLPGTDAVDGASDLCQLADKLGVMCTGGFNGVWMLARPGDNPLKIAADYQTQISRREACRIARER